MTTTHTTDTTDQSDALTWVAEWCAKFARAAEIILGYPAALMSAAEWREVGWRMWPEFITPDEVQALRELSEWLAKTVPLVEKRARVSRSPRCLPPIGGRRS